MSLELALDLLALVHKYGFCELEAAIPEYLKVLFSVILPINYTFLVLLTIWLLNCRLDFSARAQLFSRNGAKIAKNYEHWSGSGWQGLAKKIFGVGNLEGSKTNFPRGGGNKSSQRRVRKILYFFAEMIFFFGNYRICVKISACSANRRCRREKLRILAKKIVFRSIFSEFRGRPWPTPRPVARYATVPLLVGLSLVWNKQKSFAASTKPSCAPAIHIYIYHYRYWKYTFNCAKSEKNINIPEKILWKK